jgi:hypothetical protein
VHIGPTRASPSLTPCCAHPRVPRPPAARLARSRWFVFEASSLSLRYYDAPGAPAAKGAFEMSPTDLFATLTNDHGRPHEIKITSKGQTLYAAAETEDAAAALLNRIDVARRSKIAGDDGKELVAVEAAERAAAAGTAPGEPGVKAFTWGVGSMLAINAPNVQGLAFPQRVPGLKQP